jgi:dTDP-4-dehydrorhamnose reductase
MRVLVLGSAGMLGHIVVRYFKENTNYEVYGLARRKIEEDTILMNVTQKEFIGFLNENTFDVIINCIGILNKSAEDNKANAVYLNSYLPHMLEAFFQHTETRIIQISTDCVFSGEKGNYNENSLKDGLTFYDRSKALGEIENKKDLTLRMSIIGPDVNEKGIGLFNWFMRSTGIIYGYTQVFWNGVTTLELAKGILAAIDQNLTGLYHFVPDTSICKYDLLNLFRDVFKREDIKIIPVNEPSINKTLINTRTDFLYSIPSYEIMIYELKSYIDSHRYLYPQYEF